MIYRGIAATTKIDAHGMRISKGMLEKAAHDINEGKCVPALGVGHDLTILPIGKVYKAFVNGLSEDEFALHIEQEIFENISLTIINGEKYIVAKSNIDNRPFISDIVENNEKLILETDSVNFESYEKSKEYSEALRKEFNIDAQSIIRKSVIPDPELVFQLVENTVKYLLIYLGSKQVVERVGNTLVDSVLDEVKYLYAFVKKAIRTGSKYLLPKNRPVTYVFKGKLDYVIELIVKTTNPDIAIRALGKEKLKEAIDKIDSVKEHFTKMYKIQLIYNEIEDRWEFNYLTTEAGEVIGTEQSYKKSVKFIEIYWGKSESIINQSEKSDVISLPK